MVSSNSLLTDVNSTPRVFISKAWYVLKAPRLPFSVENAITQIDWSKQSLTTAVIFSEQLSKSLIFFSTTAPLPSFKDISTSE